MSNDSLARAIAHLGAVEVAPGRYAYKTANGWRLLKTEDVSLAVDLRENNCGVTGRAMPAWWSPEQRFAWRETVPAFSGTIDKPNGLTFVASPRFDADNVTRLVAPYYRRITADLETGEEAVA